MSRQDSHTAAGGAIWMSGVGRIEGMMQTEFRYLTVR